MAAFTSKATGNWDAEGASTWNEAGHPQAADTVTVQNGHTVTLDSATSCATLTIDAGGAVTDATNNQGLTVSGVTIIAGTLTCGTAAMSFGSAITASYSVTLNDSGVFVGGSGTHTMGTIVAFSTSVVTLSSGTTTIDSRYATNGISIGFISTATFNHGNGTVIFTYAGTQLLYDSSNTARSFYNIIINNAACLLKFEENNGYTLTVANDLTITAGEFDTSDLTSGTSRTLIVTGNTNVTGTLTENASTTSHGSVTVNGAGTWSATSGTASITSKTGGGYAIDIDGTISNNNGTIKIDNAGIDVIIDIIGTGTVYNLSMDVDVAKTVVWEGNTTIANDVNIIDGIFTSDGAGDTLTVGGELTAETNGHLGDGTETGAWSFGALTILTGGSVTANTSIITVTGNIDNAGTFTPGNSTFVMDGTTQTLTGSWAFYHFTKSVAAADTLTFDNTATYTFEKNVTLNGVSGQLLSILSDSVGNPFDFAMTAASVKTKLEYLSVKDSDASSSHSSHKPIAPSTSTDVSGNTDWFGSAGGGYADKSTLRNYYY